jgi:hypothetical protein
MNRALPVLALTLVLAACGGASDRAATGERSDAPLVPTTRDSAGVTIHEHPADALERAPLITVDSVPMAVIGDADNIELDLSQAYRGLLLSANRVATFVRGSVWIFDADGNELERIGREGAGPQEFRNGQIARGLGDTILVTDMGNRRLALVVPGIGVVRTRPVVLTSQQTIYEAGGQIGDDDFLFVNGGFGWSQEDSEVRMPLGRLTPGSDSLSILLPLRGPPLVSIASPFTHGPEKTPLGYAGGEIGAMWGDGLLVTRPATWQLERLALDGSPRGLIRVPRPRRVMTPTLRAAEMEAFIERFRESLAKSPEALPPSFDTARIITMLRDQPTADSITHFASISVTPTGLAWLGETIMQSDSMRHFTAVTENGKIVGRVSVPRDAFVLLGDDRVILRAEDDNGIVTWQVHRLVMPAND